ncbi:MAG: glucokinase, family [Herbinix sp.]|nr:glucokinase, family [Herbinix sp.]
MNKVCFGVDIGGTAIKMGVFSLDGELLSKWEFPTRRENKDLYLQDIANEIKQKSTELKIDENDIIGVGVGIPGPVKEDGSVLELANLGGGNFNIEQELSKLTGLKVKAGNDANMAALGELWQGSGKGYRHLVFVTLGTGVGGGIVLNGNMLAGTNGAAGEIGHIYVNEEETDTCGCGKKGCLEQYASATGIVRIAKRLLQESQEESTLRTIENITAKDIFDAAKAGDVIAYATVEQACKYLGIAMAHVGQIIDPQAFVIGGGVSKAGTIITDLVQKYYEMNVMESLKKREFKLAILGNDAGIYGGARLILA